LEGVLAKRRTRAREALVWKNFYFGARRKHRIRNFRMLSSIANPTHYLEPGILDDIERLVPVSKAVSSALRARMKSEGRRS